jgi:hypothetical protein
MVLRISALNFDRGARFNCVIIRNIMNISSGVDPFQCNEIFFAFLFVIEDSQREKELRI